MRHNYISRKMLCVAIFTLVTMAYLSCSGVKADPEEAPPKMSASEHAQMLARQFIIVDGHIDLPYRLSEFMEDISGRSEMGDMDFARSKEGGLNAPFMSIYISPSYENAGAKDHADNLIDMIDGFAERWPDKFAVATSVADVRTQFKKGLISLPMGMENGAPIEGRLANLKYFYDRGIRYITLTHAKDNHICDSSYDKTRTWNGLSPFGREVVAEMNRLGIIIDVSHISDSTFYQVMSLSRAPVLATHSSCRHFRPGWERNMSDEMVRLMAENGGVICINFGSSFLSTELAALEDAAHLELKASRKENGYVDGSEAYIRHYDQFRKTHLYGTVSDVADHIDHVVAVAGIDYVGLGSDFDGVTCLPKGISDVSMYPNLIVELINRGYSDADIEKICSGNVLRVWSEVEAISRSSHSGG